MMLSPITLLWSLKDEPEIEGQLMACNSGGLLGSADLSVSSHLSSSVYFAN